MTISSLLSHHGISVPRHVTRDGRVVFEQVVSSSAGLVHPKHGIVTRVAPHTFHGGADSPVVDRVGEIWWDAPDALATHDDAVGAAFPGFRRGTDDVTGAPQWVGTIDTGRGRFDLAVTLRADQTLPTVTVLRSRLGAYSAGRWTPSPHLYTNGTLCVADRTDWRRGEHTVATAIAWGAHWLAAYTEWRASRIWPAEGVSRDAP